MKARMTEVKTYNVEPVCEKCGEVLVDDSNGSILASYPPKKRFKCVNCGERVTLSKQYWPQTVAEEFGDARSVDIP